MSTRLILIGLIVLLGHSIGRSTGVESTGSLDLLAKLKDQHPSVDLLAFVQTDADLQALIADLKQYCPSLNATSKYQVLCQMIDIALTKAFKLLEKNRPSKIKYNSSWTADSICKMKKISLTNKWIWGLLTSEERILIGGDEDSLCKKVTRPQETLRLARFFYRVATRVRQANDSVTTSDQRPDNSSVRTTSSGVLQEAKVNVVNAGDALKNQSNSLIDTLKNSSSALVESVKSKVNEAMNTTKDKVSEVVTGNSSSQGTSNGTSVSLNATDSATQQTSGNALGQKKDEQPKGVPLPAGNQTIDLVNKGGVGGQTSTNATADTGRSSNSTSTGPAMNNNASTTVVANLDVEKKVTAAPKKIEANEEGDGEDDNQSNGIGNELNKQILQPNPSAIQSDQKVDGKKQVDGDLPVEDASAQKNATPSTSDVNGNDPSDKTINEDKDSIGDDEVLGADDVAALAAVKMGDTDAGVNSKQDAAPKVREETKTKKENPSPVIKTTRSKGSGDDGWSGSFVTYFLAFTLFVVVGYLVLHNKNKVLGLLIEGCRQNRASHGRRMGGSSSSSRYQRLSQSS